MKTKEEIEALKLNWIKDPCWDIENTEGLGKYKTKLLIFRLRKELEWAKERFKKIEETKQSLKEFLGIDEILERLNRIED